MLSLIHILKNYKDEVKINYIFAAPNTAVAYFALFQKLNNYLIFDPLNNKDDIKCFAAVATSLNNYYPHTDRSKNLYNIVIKGMQNTRAPQQKVVEIPEEVVSETGIIDINLRIFPFISRRLISIIPVSLTTSSGISPTFCCGARVFCIPFITIL